MSKSYPSFNASLNPTITEQKFKDIRKTVFDLEDEWIKEIPINIGGNRHIFKVNQFQSKSWNPGKPIIDHKFFIVPDKLEYIKSMRLPSKKNLIDNIHIHVFWYTVLGKNRYDSRDYLRWQLTDRNPFVINTDQKVGHDEIYPCDAPKNGIIYFDGTKSIKDYIRYFRNELERSLNSYLELEDLSRSLSGRKAVKRTIDGIYSSRDGRTSVVKDLLGTSFTPQITGELSIEQLDNERLGKLQSEYQKEQEEEQRTKRQRSEREEMNKIEEEMKYDTDADVRLMLEEADQEPLKRTKSMEDLDAIISSYRAVNRINKRESPLVPINSSDSDLGGGKNKKSNRRSTRKSSRKSSRKSTRRSTRKSSRKSTRRSTRRSTRKSSRRKK